MRSRVTFKLRLIAATTALLIPVAAFADNTLRITATIVGSVLLTVQHGANTISGAGGTTLAASFNSRSDLQTAPAGFTLTHVDQRSALTSSIQAHAVKANMPATTYSLTARLQRPLPQGVVWRVNGVALSDTSAATVLTSTDFGATSSLSWEIIVDDSATGVNVDNTIVFTVVPK